MRGHRCLNSSPTCRSGFLVRWRPADVPMPRYKIFSQRMEKNRTPISRKATRLVIGRRTRSVHPSREVVPFPPVITAVRTCLSVLDGCAEFWPVNGFCWLGATGGGLTSYSQILLVKNMIHGLGASCIGSTIRICGDWRLGQRPIRDIVVEREVTIPPVELGTHRAHPLHQLSLFR